MKIFQVTLDSLIRLNFIVSIMVFDFLQLYARNMGISFLVKRYYLRACIDCTLPTSLTTLVGSTTLVLTIKLLVNAVNFFFSWSTGRTYCWIICLSGVHSIRDKVLSLGCYFPLPCSDGGFNVCGFIDNTMNATCRPGGGPCRDGTNAP